MTETQTINTKEFIESRVGPMPEFVRFDEALESDKKIVRRCRHDGTLIHTHDMLSDIMKETGSAIFGLSMMSKDIFLRQTLTLGNITIESEFRGICFSRDDEDSGEMMTITMPYKVEGVEVTDNLLEENGYIRNGDGSWKTPQGGVFYRGSVGQ